MRRHILSGLIAAAATLTASNAFAGCCNTSYGYGYGYGGYGSAGYGYDAGSYSTGVTYNVPAVSITVPATYSSPPYNPSYFVNQGPSYTGPNVTNFSQPYYGDEGYSYPYSYPGASGVRYRATSYPYVRSTWSNWRWRQPSARPYAGRSYVSWRYQSQYRGYRTTPRYALGYRSAPRPQVGPHGGPRRPYGY